MPRRSGLAQASCEAAKERAELEIQELTDRMDQSDQSVCPIFRDTTVIVMCWETALKDFSHSDMFDFGAYGAAGVSEHGTLLDFTEDEVRARRLIRGGKIRQATKIFCNSLLPPSILEAIDDSECELVICTEERTQ